MKVNPDKPLSFGKMQDGNVNHGPFENWNDINWSIVEVRVFRLQTQIYNLSQNGKKEEMWDLKDYSQRTTMPNYFQ